MRSGGTTSNWMQFDVPTYQSLQSDLQVDVCIVGAGIAGLTTALFLAQAGQKVAVLDDGKITYGETSRTTAHLTFALDDRFSYLERIHGYAGSRLAAESHRIAVDLIEHIVQGLQIDCDFERVSGYLFLAPNDDRQILEEELAAAHRAGLTNVELLETSPVPALTSSPVLHFPRQGQFHPLKYLARVAQEITKLGGHIFTETEVEEVEGGLPATVTTTSGHTVTAKSIVVATNSPINSLLVMHVKQAPYRTYAIGIEVPRGSIPHGLYWDTADPYHYVRLAEGAADHELLIVGGEDHKTGQADDTEQRFAALEQWAHEHFAELGAVKFHWSGQVMEPFDGLAYIGRNALDDDNNVYIATGDSGHGMTHGTIAGKLISDLILGRENPWTDLYDPGRVSLRAAKTYLKEGANIARQYADWFTSGEVKSTGEIGVNSGGVIREGLMKVAVYRDEHGQLHRFSAVCTHLGCIVDWNDTEKSWDCPCHGSRFKPHGDVLNGPSVDPLASAEKDD